MWNSFQCKCVQSLQNKLMKTKFDQQQSDQWVDLIVFKIFFFFSKVWLALINAIKFAQLNLIEPISNKCSCQQRHDHNSHLHSFSLNNHTCYSPGELQSRIHRFTVTQIKLFSVSLPHCQWRLHLTPTRLNAACPETLTCPLFLLPRLLPIMLPNDSSDGHSSSFCCTH